ncbi:capsule biosynthesis protein [Roseococcus sp. SYP-B2431]|uniref:capsule biosynthesis protein n=1 Tax=Roseococcus sp. SYP-B2431 TaxID=2496640 RepID=UPI00103AD25B|nr:capsule biosynthesis protein [Roseococcus sp. SYP-B2431]TCH98923.1 capsule biosynthesis protein [Roseococcus sp. SYP-B2431]
MKIWTRLSPNTSSSSRTVAAPGASPAAAPASSLAHVREKALRERSPERPLLGSIGDGMRRRRTLGDWLREHPYTCWVLFPTLLAGLYLFLVASPQYLSESRFTVRSQMPRAASNNVGGEILGSAGFITSPENIAAVRDFLLSYDSIRRVREQIDLLEVFRPSFADPVFRLWWAQPTAERLRMYFRWQVTADIDASTMITNLRVWSFRPTDSQEISRRLLSLGEELVNEMNFNIREEALRASRNELQRAEERLVNAQTAVTLFRQTSQSLDPGQSSNIAVSTIGQLEADAARARSELQTLLAFSRSNSPQVQNLRNRIAALDSQAVEERRRLAAAGTGITEQLATYTRLQSEVELATQQLSAARVSSDRAAGDAQRQQIFLLRVVEPNLAERSLFPLPYWATLYVFLSLSLLYALAWLMLAGMREHAR